MSKTLDREQIEAMEATSEMDDLVAREVMGWWPQYHPPAAGNAWFNADGFVCKVFEPSDNLMDAWQVVEKMREHHDFLIRANCQRIFKSEPRYRAGFGDDSVADADTMPLSICRAALLSTL